MKQDLINQLEVISAAPSGKARPHPVLFVHGAFAAAWCWAEYVLPYFAKNGFHAYALSLRGHGASAGRKGLKFYSIRDYTDDVERIAAELDPAPILIGHSMGGMLVQKYLERQPIPAGVLLASVPPSGLLSASFGLALSRPSLFREINNVLLGQPMSQPRLREALFGRHIDPLKLQVYQRRMQPESLRAVWDMALFDLPQRWRSHASPMLVLGGELDALITARDIHATARAFDCKPHFFAGMGHALMLEPGWLHVCDYIMAWLARQGL
jgi:non-heme chloroperoxidase